MKNQATDLKKIFVTHLTDKVHKSVDKDVEQLDLTYTASGL